MRRLSVSSLVRKRGGYEAVYITLKDRIRLFALIDQREPASYDELIDKRIPDGIFEIGLTRLVGKVVYEDRPDLLVDIFSAGAEAVTAAGDE
jgi:hypothetical protein